MTENASSMAIGKAIVAGLSTIIVGTATATAILDTTEAARERTAGPNFDPASVSQRGSGPGLSPDLSLYGKEMLVSKPCFG
jgi:hypothetical protein